ncbi:uncharacterized protein Pyn_25831 [Prunus yedoensis var. nudiflora]|uniref:Uncharacterized protein n=1 Tax=Prunus yedoensis var. nudiflora TaxID=2094558 RepID=A0A314YCB3_PRUYE|nr:uncharacterized protein Pyn_25831 [Prunus yedoensis var. nudiflora]
MSKSNRCEGFVSGSGGPLVWKYLESCMHNMLVQSSEELFRNVKRSVLNATLFDPYSGGYVRVFDVQKTKTIKVYDELVLVALLDNYNALSSHLSKSLFFLFDKDDYEYTHDINMKVNKVFEMHFDKETYLGNVVIKQGTPYIVRLVHFNTPIDEIYENLKRKNSQRIVPCEVQDLQSVEIEEIGKAPILCGKLSEELVRIVQDL